MVTTKILLNESNVIDKSIRQAWLGECLGVGFGYFISHADDPINPAVLQRYRTGLTRLEQGEPLAYVVGKQAFWKHEFIVNQHTLIPRPDTEVLVETVIKHIQKTQSNKNSLSNLVSQTGHMQYTPAEPCIDTSTLKILDLGTGTGCIAISLASENPNASVTAVDFSAEALAVAKKNAELNQVSNIEFIQSNWFEALYPLTPTFDIIVSNPPYIDSADTHLQGLTAEPITALVADNHGLADIEKIVATSRDFLTHHGLLAIEHGYDQAESVQAIFVEKGFANVQTVKDYGGNDRVTYGIFDKIA
ncbi:MULTISPECIES: peptide chain release factor N(5)-glutamine methyltransferase [unclassified Moraxella]|uniref:peptide chain release factor N(5)-glutamine methyltransferase n=1 Tax=unclassified Moraxella TaxID=2685852 RepID=UPI003AF5812D